MVQETRLRVAMWNRWQEEEEAMTEGRGERRNGHRIPDGGLGLGELENTSAWRIPSKELIHHGNCNAVACSDKEIFGDEDSLFPNSV